MSNPTQTTGGAWGETKFLMFNYTDSAGNQRSKTFSFTGNAIRSRVSSAECADPRVTISYLDDIGGDCNGNSGLSKGTSCAYHSFSYNKVTCHNPPRQANWSGSAFDPCVFAC